MNIFKNKTNKYRIYCYLDKTLKVRELAEKHSVKGSVVEVHAHQGGLFKDNARVTVTFKSKDRPAVIYKAVLDEFSNYNFSINKKNISIYREIGLI